MKDFTIIPACKQYGHNYIAGWVEGNYIPAECTCCGKKMEDDALNAELKSASVPENFNGITTINVEAYVNSKRSESTKKILKGFSLVGGTA